MAARVLRGPYLEMNVEKGVGEYFFEAAEQYANRIFQIDFEKNQSETYNRVKQRSVRLALYLRKIGIKRGDVVMPLCKIDLDDVITALATLLLGASVSCLDMRLDNFDIKHCVDLVRPKIIITVQERLKLIERSLDELGFRTKIMVIGGRSEKYPNMYDSENDCTEEEENSFEPVKVDPKNDPAFILFSSGTTNLPKGIMWSHWTVMQQGLIAKNWNKPTPWHMDFCMSWGLYWNVYIWTFGICMMKGRAMILMQNETSMEQFLEVIRKYQITCAYFELARIYSALNTQKEILDKFDVSCLKSIMFAGAPIDSERILKIREIFPHAKVFNSYGSTEIGCSITSWSYERCLTKDYDTKPNSTGVPYYNLEIKVVDMHTGKLLGPNQQGEILVKSPTQALGLHNRPIPPECFDESGFFKTGDLGYYDKDGYFYVIDRIHEMFKYDSYKICPSIVENHLLKLPAIKEVAVTSIPHEDDQNHGVACIVLTNNCNLTPYDIDQFIMEHLGDIYRLRGGVKFVDALPKTPSGKIKRRAIRELFLQK